MLSPSSLQSSVGSSKQNLDYRSDIEKLTSLCKELKPSLQDKKNLQISHREYLQDEINTLEKKMKETNNMNHDLKEQLSFKDRELEKFRTQTNKQSNLMDFQSIQTNDLKEKYISNVEHTNDLLNRGKDQYLNYRSELSYKTKEISDLQNELQQKAYKMSSAIVSNDKNFEKIYLLEKQLQMKQDEILQLTSILEKVKKENEELTFSRQSESISMIEVEHLRNDVKRLLQMLKSTNEFKDFADFADDTNKSITFLKEIPVKSIVDCKCACIKCKHVRPCLVEENKYIDEKMLWAPTEAFNFIHQYRLQYKGELNEALIENLFFELNKIWCKKEEKGLDRIKNSFSHELGSLKRQLQTGNKYDNVINKQEITRLKGQLKKAYKENREDFDNRQKRNPPSVEIIKETMKMKAETEKYKRRFLQENTILKDALTRIESNQFKDNSEKAVFLEGVSWAASKLQQECEESLENLFRIVKRYSMGDDSISERAQLISSLESALTKIKNHITYLKENSEKEMGNAKLHIRRSFSNKFSYFGKKQK